ncbi:N-acetylneuraminate lyase [Coccinella septempunctata]|uniref:N-acetylneuraminate lyase n=1 Tax=Coccinella septempunctata TaxID=41139 RepID=UPI001D07F4AB|nr:N-acetylneuraminate lyase [Coccinella septempunctata]
METRKVASKYEVPEESEEENATDKTEEPKTAKDLFAVFAPDSESESDAEAEEDKDFVPTAKKKKVSSTPPSGKKKYLQKYQAKWNDVPSFKPWLSPSVHGDIYFYCKFCKKDYKCGKSEILKHMSSKKHKQHTQPQLKVHKKFFFRGLLCPVFTPFKKSKSMEVNYGVISQYSNFLKACGVKGILLNDQIGEGMSLTLQERKSLTEEWIQQCDKNGQFLMVQIGGVPLKEVIELANHCEVNKVGAVVLLPDLYNRPRNHLDLVKYIKLVAEGTKEIPILYHHHPKYTNLDLDMTNFLLDITGEVDSFVGLIHSTNDLQSALSSFHVNEKQFTVFMGTDEVILGAAASGFSCIMANTSNVFAKLVETICFSITKGEILTAQKTQAVLAKALYRIFSYGDTVPALKAAMCIISKLPLGSTREPLEAIWEGNLEKMKNELHEMGLV